MALSASTLAAIQRSTWGHLSENENARPIDIQRSIYNRLGITDPGDRLRVLNAVRAARDSYREGHAAQDSPRGDLPYTPRGRDYTIDDPFTAYRYRVLVRITDPATGDQYSNVVLVDSTGPLSPDQIRADALGAYTSLRGPNREYVSRGQVSASATVDVEILTGGRR